MFKLKQIKKELWGDRRTNFHLPMTCESDGARLTSVSWTSLVCQNWNCLLSHQMSLNFENGLLAGSCSGTVRLLGSLRSKSSQVLAASMRVFSIYSTFIATKVASFVYFLSDGWARTCHRTARALCAHSCWWVAQSTTHLITQLRSVCDACEGLGVATYCRATFLLVFVLWKWEVACRVFTSAQHA